MRSFVLPVVCYTRRYCAMGGGTAAGMAQVESTTPQATARTDSRRWVALAIVLIAPLLTIFNQFVVNVTIATMQHDLGASFAQIQLVMAVYALAYAVLLITGGRLGDIAGRRKLFLIGLGGFILGSALCGLAPTAEFPIEGRGEGSGTIRPCRPYPGGGTLTAARSRAIGARCGKGRRARCGRIWRGWGVRRAR